MSSSPLPITTFDSRTHESYLKFAMRNLRDIRIYRFALYNFVINSLRMRYRRSALGFLWSLLNPLMTMVIISIVFSLIYKQDLRTFGIYVFTGMAPWGFISAALQAGSMSLVHAEGYLKKVYLPKLLFPVITVSTEGLNFLFSLISMYLLALVLGAEITWRSLLLPAVVIVTYIFALGLALIMAVVTVYFRDLTQIISVMLTALFYTVPIIYPVELIPPPFQGIFAYNPFFYFINLFRKILFYVHEPMTAGDWLIPLGIGLFLLGIGLFILLKNDRDIIYRL